MPRQRLLELCDELQRELAGEEIADPVSREALAGLLAGIREHLHEAGPGPETARLAREAGTVARSLDPVSFPGSRLLGEMVEKLNEMGF
jgi:hypothetical protein